jgi:hypothetical protein
LINLAQAHSSVEKAGLIGLVKLRYIESDEDLTMRGEALAKAIAIDRENGLIPFFVSAIQFFKRVKSLILYQYYYIHRFAPLWALRVLARLTTCAKSESFVSLYCILIQNEIR